MKVLMLSVSMLVAAVASARDGRMVFDGGRSRRNVNAVRRN